MDAGSNTDMVIAATESCAWQAFANVPVHKCTLAVHQVKLAVNAREDFGNRSGVTDHAASAHDLRKISTGYDGRGLIIDAALESGGAPIDELDGPHGTDIFTDILIPVQLHSTEIMAIVSTQTEMMATVSMQ